MTSSRVESNQIRVGGSKDVVGAESIGCECECECECESESESEKDKSEVVLASTSTPTPTSLLHLAR
jgi:hypothetical protein